MIGENAETTERKIRRVEQKPVCLSKIKHALRILGRPAAMEGRRQVGGHWCADRRPKEPAT